MALEAQKRKQGKPAQDEVKNTAREDYWVPIFDDFRKVMYLAPRSPWRGQLQPICTEDCIIAWIQKITPQYYEAALCSMVRIMTQLLNKDTFKNPKHIHTNEILDLPSIDMTRYTNRQKAALFYTKGSFTAMTSQLFQGLNRLQTKMKEDWNKMHLEESTKPAWFTKLKFVNLADKQNFSVLNKTLEQCKKKSINARGRQSEGRPSSGPTTTSSAWGRCTPSCGPMRAKSGTRRTCIWRRWCL